MRGHATTVTACGVLALASFAFRAVAAKTPDGFPPVPSAAEAVKSPRLPDREAPSILPLPVEPTPPGEPLVLRARVTDPSGVREVVLLAKGEGDSEYARVPMVEVEKDLYAAAHPAAPERDGSVLWLVEATDSLGNGPRRAGDPAAPFIASPVAGGTPSGPLRRVASPHLAVLALAAVVVPAAGVWRSRARRRARERLALPDAPAGERTPDPAVHPRVEQIAEDLFWLRLLTPLLDLSPGELQKALTELLARDHPHPSRGRSRFERHVVLARLSWAQRVDPANVLSRWRQLRGPGRPRAGGRAGEAPARREAAL
jgi:hypothetical protein